jgi:hypothetical protein
MNITSVMFVTAAMRTTPTAEIAAAAHATPTRVPGQRFSGVRRTPGLDDANEMTTGAFFFFFCAFCFCVFEREEGLRQMAVF